MVALANDIRAICEEIGLPSFPKTSGASGLHVLVPLGGRLTYEQSRMLAELIARLVVRAAPGDRHDRAQRRAREGKVYVDFLQNGHGRLLVAPFSVRPLPGAPVSMPLRWREVNARLDPRRFTIRNARRAHAPARRRPARGRARERARPRRGARAARRARALSAQKRNESPNSTWCVSSVGVEVDVGVEIEREHVVDLVLELGLDVGVAILAEQREVSRQLDRQAAARVEADVERRRLEVVEQTDVRAEVVELGECAARS